MDSMSWTKARWEGSLFQQNGAFFEKLVPTQEKLFGGSRELVCVIHEPESYWGCFYEEGMLRFGKTLVDKFLKDKTFYESFKKEYLGIIRDVNTTYDNLELMKDNLKEISNGELAEKYLSLIEMHRKFSAYILTCEPVMSFVDQILRQKIAKTVGSSDGKVDYAYLTLTSPDAPSFIQEERNELIHILEEIHTEGFGSLFRGELKSADILRRLPKNITDSIKEHAREWWWIKNNYASQPRLDEEYFVSELKEAFEKDEKRATVQFSEEKTKCLNEIGADAELREIVQITGDFIYLHDIRKATVMKWIYYMNLFINEFSRRLKLDFSDAVFMTYNEITDALMGKISTPFEEIAARKHGVSVFDKSGVHRIFTGSEAEDWKKKVFGVIEKEVEELTGNAASPGNARGKVKVLMSSSQVGDFLQGEILVASHTTPDWVVIMKKAAGIITERGGITCHAAIVSRELGIPCITGVPNVTEILKDGEIVEMDATKGVIRRLKE
jgi:phosphohistidine swiveling domain-containing protein